MCGRHMNAFQRYLLQKKEELRHKHQDLECNLQQMEFIDVYPVHNNEMYDVM